MARTIPAGGFTATTGSSSSSHLPLIVAGAAVIVLGAVALFAIHRRREAVAQRPPAIVTRQPTEAMPPLPPFRSGQAATPSVAPGWHPLPDDPTKTAYWDGTRWAAYRQWDGHQWVDAATAQR